MKKILFIIVIILTSCNSNKQEVKKVKVLEVNNVSNFHIDEKKFDLRGVGFNWEYNNDIAGISKIGANAIRTWTTKYADSILPLAKKHDLKVALGISIGKELWGFDYNNKEAVEKQFEKVKKIIEKYKNHPNLLCWVVGNELNLLFEEDGATLKDVNPKVYDAVSDIVDYIHKSDPNHPVTMTFAGVIPNHLKVALERVPQIDIVSVQVYAGLETVEKDMLSTGITKPYMITEFGPKGFWEMPTTTWGREIEEASGPKADGIIKRIHKGIINNTSGKCLGGFAFVWGNKQERTPTWYGMHHKDGSETEVLDNLTKLFTGKYPQNRAPRVDSLLLDDKIAIDNINLVSNKLYIAKVFSSDPNKDNLTFKWDITKEVVERSQGGEHEIEPNKIKVEIVKEENGEIHFKAPETIGDYRILVYVYDNKGKAGNANIPFYVNAK